MVQQKYYVHRHHHQMNQYGDDDQAIHDPHASMTVDHMIMIIF